MTRCCDLLVKICILHPTNVASICRILDTLNLCAILWSGDMGNCIRTLNNTCLRSNYSYSFSAECMLIGYEVTTQFLILDRCLISGIASVLDSSMYRW